MSDGGPMAWTAATAQANPEASKQANLPALLCRVAATIEELSAIDGRDQNPPPERP
jgi:hypothetical protein